MPSITGPVQVCGRGELTFAERLAVEQDYIESMTLTRDLRILFIVGMGRSGTTLLELLLGRLEGWVAGGELRRYWHGASIPGWVCGCGRLLADCDFWRQVRADLRDGGVDPDEYRQLLSVQR